MLKTSYEDALTQNTGSTDQFVISSKPTSIGLPNDFLKTLDDVTGRSMTLERTARLNLGEVFMAIVKPAIPPTMTPSTAKRTIFHTGNSLISSFKKRKDYTS